MRTDFSRKWGLGRVIMSSFFISFIIPQGADGVNLLEEAGGVEFELPVGWRDETDEVLEVGAVRGFYDNLPTVGVAVAFVKRRSWSEDLNMLWCVGAELGGEFFGVFDGSCLGFVGANELEEVGEWWKFGYATLSDRSVVEIGVVLRQSIDDSGMVWLVALNDNFGGVVRASNAPDDLGEQLKCAFG